MAILPPTESDTIDFKQHDLLVELVFAEGGQELIRKLNLKGKEQKLRLDFYVGPYVISKPLTTTLSIGDITSSEVLPFWKSQIRIDRELLSVSIQRNLTKV